MTVKRKAMKSSEEGSFLLSAMIFVSLISILVSVAWQIVSDQQSLWRRTRILNARDMVLTSALRNSRVATYYYYTLLKNDSSLSDFKKCMIDDGLGDDCTSLQASGENIVYSVSLVNDEQKPVIGSSSANPVKYDLYGLPCEVTSYDCPFEVYGSFTVICKDNAAACAQAYEIVFTVYVRVASLLEKNIANVSQSSASQKISISNYQTEYFPILPPATPNRGAPLSYGAGPLNWNSTYQVSGGPGSSSNNNGGASEPIPNSQKMNTNTCAAGTTIASGGSGCASFNF